MYGYGKANRSERLPLKRQFVTHRSPKKGHSTPCIRAAQEAKEDQGAVGKSLHGDFYKEEPARQRKQV